MIEAKKENREQFVKDFGISLRFAKNSIGEHGAECIDFIFEALKISNTTVKNKFLTMVIVDSIESPSKFKKATPIAERILMIAENSRLPEQLATDISNRFFKGIIELLDD